MVKYLNSILLQIYRRVRQWKKVRKYVNIWWSYGQEFGVLFFELQCIYHIEVNSYYSRCSVSSPPPAVNMTARICWWVQCCGAVAAERARSWHAAPAPPAVVDGTDRLTDRRKLDRYIHSAYYGDSVSIVRYYTSVMKEFSKLTLDVNLNVNAFSCYYC